MNIVIATALALVLFISSSRAVEAQYGQYQVPTQIYSITVDKTVGKPVSGTLEFVDNLTNGDYKFKPAEKITFQIKVKNASNTALTNVVVTDTLPSYMEYLEGGAFDATKNAIVIQAGDFAAGEEKTYTISIRSVAQTSLPLDKGLICLVNKVVAANDKVSDDDTAQFCVEKQVIKTETVPSAGPESALILYSAAGLLGAFGLRLRTLS